MDSLLVGKVASLIGRFRSYNSFATRSFLVNNFHSWRVKSDKTDTLLLSINGKTRKRRDGEMVDAIER